MIVLMMKDFPVPPVGGTLSEDFTSSHVSNKIRNFFFFLARLRRLRAVQEPDRRPPPVFAINPTHPHFHRIDAVVNGPPLVNPQRSSVDPERFRDRGHIQVTRGDVTAIAESRFRPGVARCRCRKSQSHDDHAC